MSSGGCGCSQPAMEVSPEKVKAVLERHRDKSLREQSVHEPMQRRRRPIIIPIPRIPIFPPFPLPFPGVPRQPDCPDDTCNRQREMKAGCLRMECTDPQTGNVFVHTTHWREKFIWTCPNGRQYVWCSEWNPQPGNCCRRQNIPACNGGAPGQILCKKNGVPSEP
jgi:hypothetical protein